MACVAVTAIAAHRIQKLIFSIIDCKHTHKKKILNTKKLKK